MPRFVITSVDRLLFSHWTCSCDRLFNCDNTLLRLQRGRMPFARCIYQVREVQFLEYLLVRKCGSNEEYIAWRKISLWSSVSMQIDARTSCNLWNYEIPGYMDKLESLIRFSITCYTCNKRDTIDWEILFYLQVVFRLKKLAQIRKKRTESRR